jgi:hypothetical protein
MKKLIAILLLVMFAFTLEARNDPESSNVNYVKSGDKIWLCEKMKSGLFALNIRMEDQGTLKIPFREVDSYFCNGRLFERLPVIYEGAPSGSTALMEYITSRNGLRLYKYCKYGECGELVNNTYEKAHLQFTYFIFRGGKFYLEVDQKNAPTVLPFFGIKVI